MQEYGGGLVKVDACRNEVWHVPGEFHHTVARDNKGAFWSFIGKEATLDQDMVKISMETGKVLKTIDMTEVRKNNPDVHIWRLRHPNSAIKETMAVSDHMTHGNDIAVLTEEYAVNFEQFEAGDLLISYASTNLLFVLDPDSLKVKWWRIGLGDYQHDPDWELDGRITIFNNQRRGPMYGQKFSKIMSIDPNTYEGKIIYSGEKVHFKSGIAGRQQLTKYNTRMITSSSQGWAFEVDKSGKIVFSFINTVKKENNSSLFLSNALRLSPEYFEGKPWEDCP
jgi:hypothetical protein